MRLKLGCLIGLVVSLGGALLAGVAPVRSDIPANLAGFALGLPLAVAPTLGVLVAVWPYARRPVEPAGLARGRYILGLPALLVIAPPLTLSSFALAWRDWVVGISVAGFVAAGLAIYVGCQYRVRRPVSVSATQDPRVSSLARTPGVAPVGALLTAAALIVALADTGSSTAWAWPLLPAGYTVLVTYATVIAALTRSGSVAPAVLGALGVALVAVALASPAVGQGVFLSVDLALSVTAAILIARVERLRRSALESVAQEHGRLLTSP